LIRLAGKRINADGVLVIEARRFRSQEANRADALRRLRELLQKAATPPKQRKHTRPTAASREKRLEEKKQRSEIKRRRQNRSYE
jgi:ribosome-associated protein